MKRIFSILSFLLSLNLLGQLAPVPFSWDASPPMPTGFSTNMASGSEYYISSTCTSLLQNPSSFKLDLGGRFLQMQFASQPGKVRYEIGGQTGSAPYWNGTFKVQGSVDGLVWTDLRVYTGAQSLPSQNDPSNCLLDSVTPADPLTRYVRFFFETKLSGNNSGGGGNVKIDNISISPPPFPIQKLKVYQSGAELFNPGLTQPVQAVVNNTVALPLDLFHVGLSGNLTIQSITITGPASGSYNLSSPNLPLTLTPGNAQVANINFTPNQPGTHQALLTIKSNDPTVDSVFQIQTAPMPMAVIWCCAAKEFQSTRFHRTASITNGACPSETQRCCLWEIQHRGPLLLFPTGFLQEEPMKLRRLATMAPAATPTMRLLR